MSDPIKQLRQFIPNYFVDHSRADREAVQGLINNEIKQGGGLESLERTYDFGGEYAPGYQFKLENGDALLIWNDDDELNYRLDTPERNFKRVAGIQENSEYIHQKTVDDPCLYSFSVWDNGKNTRGKKFVCSS